MKLLNTGSKEYKKNIEAYIFNCIDLDYFELENNPDKQYTVDTLYHLDCTGDASIATLYTDMRKIVREVEEIELFETPLKNTPNYYFWNKNTTKNKGGINWEI